MRTRRKQRQNRTASGIYLIELLVALILGTMFAYALLNMLSETLRLTTTNRKSQSADFMTQTTLDSIKRTSTATWQALPIGSYVLLDQGEPVPASISIAVGPNMAAAIPAWSDRSKRNKFTGQVLLDIQAGTNPTGRTAVVSVLYDNNIESKRTATMTSLHPAGVNFWPE